ncbi:MAG TPA: ABC transporter permease [Thermodesulfobacteriota bacterium]|nr:ABC transporter permease [Thermodesulfobacteriota bacterium]
MKAKSFAGYILQRVVQAVPVVIGVVILNFTLLHLAPGDPAMVFVGEAGGATEEVLKEVRKDFGLDKPLAEQLFIYGKKVLSGDLGYSYFQGKPVLELILEKIPATVLLLITAIFLAVIFGVFSGVLVAQRPASIGSSFITLLSLFGFAMPVFWLGIMLILAFSVFVPVFPGHGMMTVGISGGLWDVAKDIARHLVLPAFTLAIIYIAQYSRLTRASMLEVIGSDYVRTARAKGLSERFVIYKHALRNAILPVLTVFGIQIGHLLAGAVLVETVFTWPGMGRLMFEGILRRDYPLIMGILIFSSVLVIAANLLTDLFYGVLDPRIRRR